MANDFLRLTDWAKTWWDVLFCAFTLAWEITGNTHFHAVHLHLQLHEATSRKERGGVRRIAVRGAKQASVI